MDILSTIAIDATPGGTTPPGWAEDTRNWKVTLTHNGDPYTTEFHQGSAHTDPPTVADVLSCLLLDARYGAGTFDDYCAEIGADNDSRKEYALWEQCRETETELRSFLGDDYEAFETALEDY